MDSELDFLRIEIVGPLIAIADFIVSVVIIILSNDPRKKIIILVQFIAVLLIIMVVLGYKGPTPPEPPIFSVDGFYETYIEIEPGNTRYMTLRIREKEIDSKGNNLICTILDFQKWRHVSGRFNAEKLSIYVPGFGNGKVGIDQHGNVSLTFFYHSKEIQFSQ